MANSHFGACGGWRLRRKACGDQHASGGPRRRARPPRQRLRWAVVHPCMVYGKGYARVMCIPFPGTTCWPRIARPRLSPPCPSAIAAILTKGHSSVDFDHTRRGYQSHHDHDETPRRGLSLAPGLASLRRRLLPSPAHRLVERHRGAARASLSAQGLDRWHPEGRPQAPDRGEAHTSESGASNIAVVGRVAAC